MLTGTPPGTANVGEIILRDLSLHFGPGDIQCIAVVPPRYVSKSDAQLEGLSVEILPSVHVHAQRWSHAAWGAIGSLLNYLVGFRREVARLVDSIVGKAEAAKPDVVFAVLNNPLMMSVGHRVARALDRPLVTLVWDPPDYLARASRFDRWSRRHLLREFRCSLAASRRVAVVSETMQQDYAGITEAPIQILRHGMSMELPEETGSDAGMDAREWVIGFAGSMYSDCAWGALLKALDQADWQIAGRPVRLKVLGARIALSSRTAAQVEFLGFRSPEQVQSILSQCHLNYMPQPFVPHLAELCRYAFPTKLTNYLATGRPVFVHAPREGALSRFFEANPIGARATTLDPGQILDALEALLGNEQAYRDACRQVRATAGSHFDVAVFHRAIDDLFETAKGVERTAASLPLPGLAT